MNNQDKIILDLCGGTGSWSRPYKDAGYDVRLITLPRFDITDTRFINSASVGIEFNGVQDEVGRQEHLFLSYKGIYGILAAPPCTMFSFARTTAKIPRDLIKGFQTVEACLQIIWRTREHNPTVFWALENPMGYLRQFLGKPAFTFDPSQFGADYNKTTDLWGYFNQPKMGKKTRYESTDKNTRKLPVIPKEYTKDSNMTDIQIKRSITPQGFAQAFFKANL